MPWAVGLLALTTVAAWGGIAINQFSTAPCALQPEGCTDIPIWMKGAAEELQSAVLTKHMSTFFFTRLVSFVRGGVTLASVCEQPLTTDGSVSLLQVASEHCWHRCMVLVLGAETWNKKA